MGDVLLLMAPRIKLGRTATVPAVPAVPALSLDGFQTVMIVSTCAIGDFSSFSSLPADPAAAGRLLAQTPVGELWLAPSLICARPS